MTLPAPTADIIKLQEAVVLQMNSGIFNESFTATRGYLPTYELPEKDSDLRVTVLAKEDSGKLDTRASSRHQYVIDIAVQKRPANVNNESLDPLVYLTQQIADFFRFGKAPGGASLVAPQTRVLYMQEHLQTFRQFTAVVTLTFQGWREAT